MNGSFRSHFIGLYYADLHECNERYKHNDNNLVFEKIYLFDSNALLLLTGPIYSEFNVHNRKKEEGLVNLKVRNSYAPISHD